MTAKDCKKDCASMHKCDAFEAVAAHVYTKDSSPIPTIVDAVCETMQCGKLANVQRVNDASHFKDNIQACMRDDRTKLNTEQKCEDRDRCLQDSWL